MTGPLDSDLLDLETLRARYASGEWTAEGVFAAVLKRIEANRHPNVWISRTSADDLFAQVRAIEARKSAGEKLPLFGVPVAVKDNIDVAGLPTTAACPAFSYTPSKSASAVRKLQLAGAIVVGKTNLDQFATGLVGARSPYGACRSTIVPSCISGGSSSGSAVAVSGGLVSIALGTDTAGSGRVPAAFNNIVGVKPTRGFVSAAGVLPACQSLDCVSIFALTCDDANAVLEVISGFDPEDPFARPVFSLGILPQKFRFGRPSPAFLKFFGNEEYASAYRRAIESLRELGGEEVEIDYAPFEATARLLYEGPWVAERVAGVREFWEKQPDAFFPVTRQILSGAARYDAVGAFEAMRKLAELRRLAEAEWKKMDVLFLPTAGTTYTIGLVEAEPITTNTNLGYYTNFVNLLDLSAIAVPSAITPGGYPFGVTLMAPAGGDRMLYALGRRIEAAAGLPVGATGKTVRQPAMASGTPDGGMVRLAVVGAHLSGLPLNHQLTALNAKLVHAGPTSPFYRFYALPGTVPPKPGMVRSAEQQATGIEVEVWEMSQSAFGGFVAAIPPPLGIGSIELADGSWVKGFLCESYVLGGAAEITSFGGWRKYLAR